MFDSKVHVLDHPLLQHKLSILRDERTGVKEFREIVSEIATLECYEATRDLPLEDVEIKTPVATGGVLLQDASRHRRAGRHRPGSHAGYRRLRRGGHPVPEKL